MVEIDLKLDVYRTLDGSIARGLTVARRYDFAMNGQLGNII